MHVQDTMVADAVETGSNPNLDPLSVSSSETLKASVDLLTSSSSSTSPKTLHKVTPLIRSDILSKRTGHNVFLKLDCLQPSGSFKIRGIGAAISNAFEKYGSSTHVFCSSGGNAGLAAATACKTLGLRCSIYVPVSTEQSVIALLRRLEAEVYVHGDAWDQADSKAREAMFNEKGAIYIHPFEGETLIKGHATLSHEIYEQMEEGQQPDLICCTVGGGGMIAGIILGLSDIQKTHKGYKPPKLVATQDFGADSFSQSINLFLADPAKNAEAHITLPAITSKATSMGAKRCSAASLQSARQYAMNGSTSSPSSNSSASSSRHFLSTAVFSDSLSASACWQFKRDHDLMVELSCGAALAPIYHSERILPKLIAEDQGKKNIVIIVCGGSKVDQEMLDGYERDYGEMEGRGEATVDGLSV